MTTPVLPTVELKRLLNAAASGETFDEDAMQAALDLLASGIASPVQMAAFLVALRVRGETVAELTGAAKYLRDRMIPADAPPDAVDIVGTGGDNRSTFNVSTCAALVAAGAGLKVAKHGNRSVSSLSGASDVLGALGVRLDVPPVIVARAIGEAGVGFLWAPLHHPAMKQWAPVRTDLGLRTIFNLLGPVCNPAGVKRQILGVYHEKWLEPIAGVLRNLGSERAWVVHGADGLDELTTTSKTHVAELNDGRISRFTITPEDAGLPRVSLRELQGGDETVNAAALRDVLAGEPSAYRDIVCLNAAAALLIGGKAASLTRGVELAAAAIDNGSAAQALDKLVAITNER